MNFVYGLVVGVVLAGAGFFIWQKTKSAEEPLSENPNPDVAIKKENLAKLEAFLADKEQITNDEVQSMFKVSDATAERYLQELEQKGLIRQEGEIGQAVYYVKI